MCWIRIATDNLANVWRIAGMTVMRRNITGELTSIGLMLACSQNVRCLIRLQYVKMYHLFGRRPALACQNFPSPGYVRNFAGINCRCP